MRERQQPICSGKGHINTTTDRAGAAVRRAAFDHGPGLFDTPAQPEPPKPAIVVNATVDKREVKRLSRQCVAILERLQRGPATNRELSELSLKYTGRISELRQAGYNIKVTVT